MNYSFIQKTAVILTTVYFIFLIWAIIFKFQLSLDKLPDLQHINLIPFGDSSFKAGKFNTSEVLSNFIIFVPFGIYLNLIPWKLPYLIQILIIATGSIAFEVLQYIFAIGVSDITDILMNVIGGVSGILFYLLLKKISKNGARLDKYLIIISAIGTVLMFVLVTILFVN